MNRRVTLALIATILALGTIVLFSLSSGETALDSNARTRDALRDAGASGENNRDEEARDGAFGLFGEPGSAEHTATLDSLSEKFPNNRYLKAIVDPRWGRAVQEQLYATAVDIEAGRAKPEQIERYYETRLAEIADEIEILREVPDQSKVRGRIQELEAAGLAMQRFQEKKLKEKRKAAQ